MNVTLKDFPGPGVKAPLAFVLRPAKTYRMRPLLLGSLVAFQLTVMPVLAGMSQSHRYSTKHPYIEPTHSTVIYKRNKGWN